MSSADIYVSFGADTGGLEAAMAVSKAEVADLTREINKLGREMEATGAASDSALAGKLRAVGAELAQAKERASGFKESLKGAGEGAAEGGFLAGLKPQLESALAPIAAMKASLGEIVELVAVAFAAEKLIEFVKGQGEAAEATERTARTLGISVEQAQQLAFAAKMAGLSADDVTHAMLRFELSLAKAATGTGPAAAGLKSLGLSAQELVGIPVPEQLAKIADALARLKDGPNKIAAMEAINRQFPQMIMLLDQGSGRLKEWNATFATTNSAVNAETNERLVAMNDAFKVLGESVSGLAKTAFAPFIDAVTGLVTILADAAQSTGRFVTENTFAHQALELLAFAVQTFEVVLATGLELLKDFGTIGNAAFRTAEEAAVGFGGTVKEVFVALTGAVPNFFSGLLNAGKQVVEILVKEFLDLGSVIGNTLTLHFAAAKAASHDFNAALADGLASIKAGFAGTFDMSGIGVSSKAAAAEMVATWKDAGAKIVDAERQYGQDYAAIWGEAAKKAEGGPQKPPPALPDLSKAGGAAAAKAAKDALAAAMAADDLEVDHFKKAASEKEEILNEQLKTHAISMGQWLQKTEEVLSQEAAQVKATYDQEAQIAGLTAKQVTEIRKKEFDELSAIAKQETAAESKAAEETAEAWKSAADKIADVMDSQVDALLKGTETIKQAFKNMAASMIEDVIKFAIKWVAEHAAAVAANMLGFQTQVVAHTAGDATMAGADAAASSAGIAATLANKAAIVASDMGQAGAGVAAFLAPFIGPAAIGAGASAAASVGGIGMMDIGAWDVPRDQLAFIHKNEMVATPSQADGLRNLVENGGAQSSSNSFRMGDMHLHQQPGQDGEQLARDFLRTVRRKGVFAGNSARRFAPA
jgi:hypothetical protein